MAVPDFTHPVGREFCSGGYLTAAAAAFAGHVLRVLFPRPQEHVVRANAAGIVPARAVVADFQAFVDRAMRQYPDDSVGIILTTVESYCYSISIGRTGRSHPEPAAVALLDLFPHPLRAVTYLIVRTAANAAKLVRALPHVARGYGKRGLAGGADSLNLRGSSWGIVTPIEEAAPTAKDSFTAPYFGGHSEKRTAAMKTLTGDSGRLRHAAEPPLLRCNGRRCLKQRRPLSSSTFVPGIPVVALVVFLLDLIQRRRPLD